MDRAIENAVRFLESRQLPSGEIPVFTSRAAVNHDERVPDPSIFPTALVARALVDVPRATRVRDRALDYLVAEQDADGLWRHWPRAHPHHHELPPDLDDTSVASMALLRGGREVPANRKLLLANRDARGLFYTWVTPRLQRSDDRRHRRITRAQLRHPLVLFLFFRRTSASPLDVDAVVNANVISYLGARDETRAAIAHLLDVLRANRETSCDKWYENPFAVWYAFSHALHACAPEAGAIITSRIAAATPANALELALATSAMSLWNETPDLTPLLDAQLPSGGWPHARLYHGGRARKRDGSFDAPHPDTPHWGSEELTTAFCIEALARAGMR
ncbi:MAG TPA: hypothetical protein VF608_08835 [Thermoanaerobaculia bacterium]